ncbi:MAG: hypothetical protein ACREO4_07915 [Lysobacter sp.]
MTDQWRESYGRWELWRGNRMIAAVQAYDGRIRVVICARMEWQTLHGHAGTVQQAKRGIERWLAHHAPEK